MKQAMKRTTMRTRRSKALLLLEIAPLDRIHRLHIVQELLLVVFRFVDVAIVAATTTVVVMVMMMMVVMSPPFCPSPPPPDDNPEATAVPFPCTSSSLSSSSSSSSSSSLSSAEKNSSLSRFGFADASLSLMMTNFPAGPISTSSIRSTAGVSRKADTSRCCSWCS
uniref:Uncharacterized protein n=1 Tax=Anopheles atroparvus TaxID=41427 RepID=A0A182J5Z4_ANOAO